MSVCPGCGYAGPDAEGPQHAYMRASPACWAAFGRLQADEFALLGYPPAHGVAVDAYAASHGGPGDERRDRQSVFIHLMAICAVLERGVDMHARIGLLQRMTKTKADWPLLERPPGFPALTHAHASGAADELDYDKRVREWAGAVWKFWSPAHDQIRARVETGWN